MRPSAIGPFQIMRELGRGGMGEVYLARDTRLDRQVAIKSLPPQFAADADRFARFQREARILASLNHPGVGAIYGLEEVAGHQYLVLEFVEGETLADRLMHGALPVDEAISLARQIAEALEVAHERGVVHRDLKPGNIMVTPGGAVKVLDFGLARTEEGPLSSLAGQALPDAPTALSPTPLNSPTIPGVILGTAGYMSPEQARARPVDKRSDIFAFGCVLYEMLTGVGPFRSETVADALSAVLHLEPDWGKLPGATPPAVKRLLHRCLAKDRRERLRDIGDARFELANAGQIGGSSELAAAQPSRPVRFIALGLVAGLGAALGGLVLWGGFRRTPAGAGAAPLTHLAIPMPAFGDADAQGFATASLNITPDGRGAVFTVGDGATSAYGIFNCRLETSGSTYIAPGLPGYSLIISPDSRWLAFQGPGKFFKVPLSGGVPTPLCDLTDDVRGGCWLDDGTIVLTRSAEGGLWRLSESGGAPTPLTELDLAAGELSHRWPEALPGARGVLYVVKTGRLDSFDQADIWVLDLRSGARKRLVTGGTMPRFLPETPQSGLLIFSRNDRLWAARMDLRSLTVSGIPLDVWSNVAMRPALGLAGYAVAREAGTLLYLNADRTIDYSEPVWVDSATGTSTPLGVAPALYTSPSIGPAGEIAFCINAANDYITLFDDRGISRRLTRGGNFNNPVWSATGDALYCFDTHGRVMHIPIADPSRMAPVPGLDHGESITSCSADGALILFTRRSEKTGADIWQLRTDGSAPPEPLIATPEDEDDGTFSPDGKSIAYTQTQDGKRQVFVRRAGSGPDQQVSLAGGGEPNWSADGLVLYFRRERDVLAVAVPADGTRPGPPRVLFSGPYSNTGSSYARGIQQGRFLMTRLVTKPSAHLDVVLNWTAEVRRKLDAAKP